MESDYIFYTTLALARWWRAALLLRLQCDLCGGLFYWPNLLPRKRSLDALIWDNGQAYVQHRESSAPTGRDCPPPF